MNSLPCSLSLVPFFSLPLSASPILSCASGVSVGHARTERVCTHTHTHTHSLWQLMARAGYPSVTHAPTEFLISLPTPEPRHGVPVCASPSLPQNPDTASQCKRVPPYPRTPTRRPCLPPYPLSVTHAPTDLPPSPRSPTWRPGVSDCWCFYPRGCQCLCQCKEAEREGPMDRGT